MSSAVKEVNDKMYKYFSNHTLPINVYKNGKKVQMTYKDICYNLGIDPDTHFVEITTRGTISFTAGKSQEITYLYKNAIYSKFIPSKKLAYICKNMYGM